MNITTFRLPIHYTELVYGKRPIYQEYSTPGAVNGHYFGSQVSTFLTSSGLLVSPEYDEIILISFDSPILTPEVLRYFQENRYLPATAKELIGLYVGNPDTTLQSHIVAFGQQVSHLDGCVKVRCVPDYWKWAHQDIGWHLWAHRTEKWKTFWQFAAVKISK